MISPNTIVDRYYRYPWLFKANGDWVRDVLTRLAAAMKGDDHD